MRRTSRAILLLAAAGLLLTSLLATPAHAAKRKVPFGFFGVTLISELSTANRLTDAQLDQQLALMAGSGVESLRVSFSWSAVQPEATRYNWTALDRLVAAAARHRISLIVNISGGVRWNTTSPPGSDYTRYPPKDPKAFGEMMRQAMLRYGSKGTFWSQNPGVPKVPVRKWQIWNEQMAPWYWAPRPWAPTYVKILKASYKAIKKADKRAKVMAGSLMSYGNYHQWDGVRDMYRQGAKGYFDEIAVHPFTNDPKAKVAAAQTIEILRRVRTVLKRNRDTRKTI